MNPEIKQYIELVVQTTVALSPVILGALPVLFQAYSLIKSNKAEGTVKRAGQVAANAAAQHLLALMAQRGGKATFSREDMLVALAKGTAAADKVLTTGVRKAVRSAYVDEENIATSVASIRDANMVKVLAAHGVTSLPTTGSEPSDLSGEAAVPMGDSVAESGASTVGTVGTVGAVSLTKKGG